MQQISVDALAKLGPSATIIDVREPAEVAEVRIPYATNIPLSQLAERVSEIPSEGAYVMCHAGGRSARAADYLERLGISITDVEGGMSAWEDADLPVERG